MRLNKPHSPHSFLCVSSGISAPTVAWRRFGWKPLAYAEIDPFACAVLSERHGAGKPRHMPRPEDATDQREARRRAAAIKNIDKRNDWGAKTPNHGDFTLLRDEEWIVDADILIGGTPCQDFSLAGLRAGIEGQRGNLTMEFIRLANTIDDLRRDDGRPPALLAWENVPGVFTTGNAFGTFMAGVVGADRPLAPPKGRGWTDSGVVAGPRRVAAWRVLDSQHFGLAQRRRRVFVLARGGPGAWAVADALLPIRDSLSGHPPPRRKAGQGVARSLTSSLGGPSAKEQQYTFVDGDGRPLNALGGGEDAHGATDPGAGSGGDGAGGRGLRPGVAAYGGQRTHGPAEVATALNAHGGAQGRHDFATETFVVEPEPVPAITTRPYADGGADDSRLVLGPEPFSVMPMNSGKDFNAVPAVVAQPLVAHPGGGNQGGDFVVEPGPIPFDTTQITHPENRSNPKPGDPSPPLTKTGHPPSIAFSSKDYGADADPSGETAPTLRAMNFDKSHPNSGGQIAVVVPGEAIAFSAKQDAGTHGDISPAIDTDSLSVAVAVNFEHGLAPHGSMKTSDIAPEITAAEAKGHTAVLQAQAFSMRGRGGENMIEPETDPVSPAIRTAGGGSSTPMVATYEPTESYSFKPSHYTRGKDGAPSTIVPALSADADKGDQDPLVLAFQERGRPEGRTLEIEDSDVHPALTSPSGGGRAHEKNIAISYEGATEFLPQSSRVYSEDEVAPTLQAVAEGGGNKAPHVHAATAVRRLTPTECERLQGYPDHFTLIEYSDAHRSEEDLAETIEYLRAAGFGDNEAAALAITPDGPRYRVLGNTMSVDVIEELGERIAWALDQ